MIKKSLSIIIFIISLSTSAQDYMLKQVVDSVGDYENWSNTSVNFINLGNYYPYLMICNTVPEDWYRTVVFKYNSIEDSFEFLRNLNSFKVIGAGNFDGDSMPEMLGYTSTTMAFMEQPDTIMLYDTKTSVISSGTNRASHMTNFLKNDGLYRIIKSFPESSDSGFSYYSSNGDNSYILDYELNEDRKIWTMDIGFLDDDSLVDIIAGTHRGQTWWEAKDTDNDSLVMIKSEFPGGVGTDWTILGNDIDEDGKNEYLKGGVAYLMDPCQWGMTIVEYDHDTTFNLILRDSIMKDYGYAMNVSNGSDIDLADVDGDGKREIIWCAGCVLRIYDVVGNDSFQKVWEMDNDTFSGSHVKCYDFNENGRAEIIWEGASDPALPLTDGIFERKTYVFEYYPDYYTNTLDSAKGTDGRIVQSGIDKDDMVTLYFSQITDMPAVNKSNIDSIFRLSNGHSWLDGSGNIKGASWSGEGGNRLIVQLSDSISQPTISIGDTVYLDTLYLNGIRVKRPFKGTVVLNGTFGPSGINSRSEGAVFDLSFKGLNLGSSILEYTTYTKDTRVDLYDITGRNVFTQKSSHIGSNRINISSLKSGIYFLRISTLKEKISKSIIQM